MTWNKEIRKARKIVSKLSEGERWALQQALAEPGRYYGNGGTVHAGAGLDIELGEDGVDAVWFRCQQLPFQVVTSYGPITSPPRLPGIAGVVLLDVEKD